MADTKFTAVDKRNCANRELLLRKRVYPRWVADGRMTRAKADLETALMAEIVADYTALASAETEKERLI